MEEPREQDTLKLLTVREVAAALRVCTATVYRLCERGELAHLRVANAIRISKASVAAYTNLASPSGESPGT